MMFRFPAGADEFRRLAGENVHAEIERPEMHFALSSRVFDMGPESWYTLGFDYRRGEMSGRAFINTYGDVKAQMRRVSADLQGKLNRKLSWFAYNPAGTWEGSVDGIGYIRRTGNTNFAGLSGFIPA
ncbi:MAG: hypothetical protein HY517_00910 [Candidatus Aenigmarchaeota archaeon]|nr:hypothetical protein [Candidatus Aenigmarchaeota archaeon]